MKQQTITNVLLGIITLFIVASTSVNSGMYYKLMDFVFTNSKEHTEFKVNDSKGDLMDTIQNRQIKSNTKKIDIGLEEIEKIKLGEI